MISAVQHGRGVRLTLFCYSVYDSCEGLHERKCSHDVDKGLTLSIRRDLQRQNGEIDNAEVLGAIDFQIGIHHAALLMR